MKKLSTKLIVLLLAVALLFGCGVGGTIAWLMTATAPVVNTFTVGNINITLAETGATLNNDKYEQSFKMVPGSKIAKDPKITVLADSEDCYLFVKIEEGNNTFGTEKYINYNLASGWQAVDGQPGVYYRMVGAKDENQSFNVLAGEGDGNLKNGFVTVNSNITKTNMNAWEAAPETLPTLAFTAYAVQSANIAGDTVAEKAATAWAVALNNGAPTTP